VMIEHMEMRAAKRRIFTRLMSYIRFVDGRNLRLRAKIPPSKRESSTQAWAEWQV